MEVLAIYISVNLISLPMVIYYFLRWNAMNKSSAFNDNGFFDYVMDRSFLSFITFIFFACVNGLAAFMFICKIVYLVIS